LWQNLLRDSTFFLLLVTLDRDLAEQVRTQRCPRCASRLDYGRYARKPRGGPPGLPPDYGRRESLCCAAAGCRKRVLPPSLRFFGRRLYLGPVFVLVSAMVHGITEKRAAALRDLVGVSVRTLARWRIWWRQVFPQTRFWHAARARFAPPVTEVGLPASLVARFTQEVDADRVVAALRFLAPVTAGSGCAVDR
jgi:hypothetical protein